MLTCRCLSRKSTVSLRSTPSHNAFARCIGTVDKLVKTWIMKRWTEDQVARASGTRKIAHVTILRFWLLLHTTAMRRRLVGAALVTTEDSPENQMWTVINRCKIAALRQRFLQRIKCTSRTHIDEKWKLVRLPGPMYLLIILRRHLFWSFWMWCGIIARSSCVKTDTSLILTICSSAGIKSSLLLFGIGFSSIIRCTTLDRISSCRHYDNMRRVMFLSAKTVSAHEPPLDSCRQLWKRTDFLRASWLYVRV